MPYQPVNVVEVRCWGTRVGAVALDDRTGFYVFEYEPAWADRHIELAPSTMPTRGSARTFVFPTLPANTFYRLPALLADSLPDDFGNALTNAYLANQGVRPGDITPLDRLAYLGERGLGALEFRPSRGPLTRRATAIELGELVVAARGTIAGSITSEPEITDALSHLIAVGTSAGGARAKAVVALNPATGELRSGQLPVDAGFEHWLLKLDGVGADLDLGASADYGRIEFAYSEMAKSAGIEMTDCRLLQEGGRAHFMTRRFDRPADGSKVHVQTLCALAQLDFRLKSTHDYAQLFLQIEQLGMGPAERAQAFTRMVFNVAAANCDDHTKNFSFTLPPAGDWQLAPAYDITHAHATTSEWTHQHLMAVNGHHAGITGADVAEVGDRFAVPGASTIVEQVLNAVGKWPQLAADAGVSQTNTEQVARDIEKWSAPLR
ncbi:MAG: type II toxin-antitoxin system HipA family toxin [Actinomycetia bacterium]|nr:type II toxin-antitoxin system HipA family toxin [Actinomycetes bacterium]